MTKSEIIIKLEQLFTHPKTKLWEKTKGSRANISKWWNDSNRSSRKIEIAALELIEQGELAKKAMATKGEPIKL
ncbi:hypothetical protein Oweho_3241 [Owenweeksia hongkongensis DSM 17368]|uniref:Uncharacterized protein n=1 Tax=Owenweeksia hongkongensis (strain DSM 17368 / CIP 108786 / JCM 12287 / NRRL B-23963 / UST20020801) TaxID=926562 RepID=G8R492_OWEHD|nr:hypothetical protein [Owenweeksia hongkongensis]AEV34192.1 hypothetical protein Oweho_3241 [Owenweeksia hongkongensis DSM 17368]